MVFCGQWDRKVRSPLKWTYTSRHCPLGQRPEFSVRICPIGRKRPPWPRTTFPLNKLRVGRGRRRGRKGRRAPRFFKGDRQGPPIRVPDFRGPRCFLSQSGTEKVAAAQALPTQRSMWDREVYEEQWNTCFGISRPSPLGMASRAKWRNFLRNLRPLGPPGAEREPLTCATYPIVKAPVK